MMDSSEQRKMPYLSVIGIILIIISGFLEVSSTEPTKDRQSNVWSSTPHDVFVLEHTTAWLNWTHRLKDDAKIVWTFVKGDNQELSLMSRVGFETEIEKREYQFRIGYWNSPGSAKMYLRNVTRADAGKYQVTISPDIPDSETHTSTLNMHVIYPSDIHISVSIEEVMYNLSVANNGTDISLEDYQMIPKLRPPSITVTVSKFMPTPISIAQTVKNKQGACVGEEFETAECSNCRKYTFPWYDEILISVHFDIQNLKVIHIRTNIHNQVSWKTKPGGLNVLAGTTGTFNWTHNIPTPFETTWTYRGDPPTQEVYIMSYKNGETTTPQTDWHSRVTFVNFEGSAAMALEDVSTKDEGIYEVKVVDLNSNPSGYFITDEVKLHVYSAYEIKFTVTFDQTEFECMAENSTVRRLDYWIVTSASTARVTVIVAATAPQPLLVAIYSHNKGLDGDENIDFATACHDACKSTRECERNVVYGLDADRHNTTEVTVNITFGIQNLSPIVVTRDIIINTGSEGLSITDTLLIFLVVLISLAALVVTGVFIVKRSSKSIRDCRSTNNDKGIPLHATPRDQKNPRSRGPDHSDGGSVSTSAVSYVAAGDSAMGGSAMGDSAAGGGTKSGGDTGYNGKKRFNIHCWKKAARQNPKKQQETR